MKALVVYDSKSGNTRRIDHEIGDTLSERLLVQVIPAAEAAPLPVDVDLLVIGGPTHAHGASEGMKALLATVSRGTLKGVPAAAFDTRFKMARWLSGSAALVIEKRLRAAGSTHAMPAESFFVTRDKAPAILPGEIERARAWAQALLSQYETRTETPAPSSTR